MKLRSKIFLFVVLSCFVSCTKNELRLPYYNTPEFTPEFMTVVEANERIPHTISDFSFQNQNRKNITQKNIEGKIHVANFIFTSCPGICPRMTEMMSKVASQYKSDSAVVLLSYSVTPWKDGPEQLLQYKAQKGVDKNDWHFLTGNKSELYTLARTSYFAEEAMGFTKDSSDFLHTEHFILVDGTKRIRGIYNGTLELEAQQLIQDIAALKAEAQ